MEAVPPLQSYRQAIISRREAQVLKLIGQGHKAPEIALRLGLSVKTVETYKEHLKKKLSCEASALHVQAIKLGLVRIEVTGELRVVYPDLCD